jgi:hypothetical protein
VNLVKDDWDGKAKDENTWNPHWKSHCDGDPKYFLMIKYQTMRILFNLTLQVL